MTGPCDAARQARSSIERMKIEAGPTGNDAGKADESGSWGTPNRSDGAMRGSGSPPREARTVDAKWCGVVTAGRDRRNCGRAG